MYTCYIYVPCSIILQIYFRLLKQHHFRDHNHTLQNHTHNHLIPQDLHPCCHLLILTWMKSLWLLWTSKYKSNIEITIIYVSLIRMDCGIISSTPLSAGSVSSRSYNKRNLLQDPSAIPNFDLPPTPDKVVSNSKSLLATPLTSPTNTTK